MDETDADRLDPRLSINLNRTGLESMKEILTEEGRGKTETVNRALAFYALYMRERKAGGRPAIIAGNGTVREVLIL